VTKQRLLTSCTLKRVLTNKLLPTLEEHAAQYNHPKMEKQDILPQKLVLLFHFSCFKSKKEVQIEPLLKY